MYKLTKHLNYYEKTLLFALSIALTYCSTTETEVSISTAFKISGKSINIKQLSSAQNIIND